MTDHNQPPRCTCINDDPDHGHTWNPECRIHGTEANRHPHYREGAALTAAEGWAEPGTRCPDDSHAAHCQHHIGGPILVDIPPAVGQSARQRLTADTVTPLVRAEVETSDCCGAPAGGDHDDDCPDYPADPPECPRQHPPGPGWVAAENHGVKLLGPSVPYIPTLGDLAQTMRDWDAAGVSAESLQYAASKVWPEVNLLTIDRDRERDRLLKEAGAAISGDRERDYGSARDGFARTGRLIAAILDLDEITAEQVALILAALKISRLAQNTGHRDSWLDLIGYAALGGDIAADTAKDAHNPFA